MELWDLRDARGRLLGRTHPRGTKLPPGSYHAVVGVWTLHRPSASILTTRRSENKDLYPATWETTSGAVIAGESPIQGAAREVREEVGLPCQASDLLPLGRLQVYESLVYVFVFLYDGPQEVARILPSEISAYAWLTLEELEEKIANAELMPPLLLQIRAFRSSLLSYLSQI